MTSKGMASSSALATGSGPLVAATLATAAAVSVLAWTIYRNPSAISSFLAALKPEEPAIRDAKWRKKLVDACNSGNLETVKAALNERKDFADLVGEKWVFTDDITMSPVSVAVYNKNAELLEYLLNIPPFPDELKTVSKGGDRHAPLDSAVRQQAGVKIVKLLLQHGADPLAMNSSFSNSMLDSVIMHSFETFKAIADHIVAKGEGGKLSPCFNDAKAQHIPILLAAGAKLTSYDAIEKLLKELGGNGRSLLPALSLPHCYKSVADDSEPGMNEIIVARGISSSISEEILETSLSQFGSIVFVYIPKDKSGNPKGFAYVHLDSSDAVTKALDHKEIKIGDCNVRLENWSKQKFALPEVHKTKLKSFNMKRRDNATIPSVVVTSIFHYLVDNKQFTLLQLVLTKFAQDPRLNLNIANHENRTPLGIAVENSDYDIVSCLITLGGVDINAQAPVTGRTPLHIAASLNNIDMMRYLLSMGADPNGPSRSSRLLKRFDQGRALEYPLHAAIKSFKAVKLLLESGADPSLRAEPTKRLALHEACKPRNLFVIPTRPSTLNLSDPVPPGMSEQILCALTSRDVHESWRSAQDSKGRTALHLLVRAAHNYPDLGETAEKLVAVLLERGIAWTVKDKDGLTAQDRAVAGCEAVLKSWTTECTVDTLTNMGVRALKCEKILLAGAEPRLMELVYGAAFASTATQFGEGQKVDLGMSKFSSNLKKKEGKNNALTLEKTDIKSDDGNHFPTDEDDDEGDNDEEDEEDDAPTTTLTVRDRPKSKAQRQKSRSPSRKSPKTPPRRPKFKANSANTSTETLATSPGFVSAAQSFSFGSGVGSSFSFSSALSTPTKSGEEVVPEKTTFGFSLPGDKTEEASTGFSFSGDKQVGFAPSTTFSFSSSAPPAFSFSSTTGASETNMDETVPSSVVPGVFVTSSD